MKSTKGGSKNTLPGRNVETLPECTQCSKIQNADRFPASEECEGLQEWLLEQK